MTKHNNITALIQDAKDFFRVATRIQSILKDTSFTTTKYLCTLAIQHPEPASFDDLHKSLGVSQPHISRLTRDLSAINSKGKLGLGLVDVNFDAYQPRVQLVRLNDKGLRTLSDALSIK